MKTCSLLLLVLLCSCAPTYVPNVRNVPLFTKGGEFQTSIQAGNGLDLQTAVSLNNHIGLMANYSMSDGGSQNDGNNNDGQYHKHKFWEGGMGYFKNTNDWCFELFAGYGRGESSNLNEFLSWNSAAPSQGKYERYFIQPSIGLNKKIFDFAFVNRVTYVDFTEYSDANGQYSINEKPKIFLEPAAVGRVNFAENFAFFTFQVGTALPASNDLYFKFRKLQMSAGLGFRIGGARPAVNLQKN
jgi:hypothetical protein